MKGIQLLTDTDYGMVTPTYSSRRLLEVARKRGIDYTVLTNRQVDVVVEPNKRDRVWIDNQAVPLPDFLLPRMGSTTYYGLAVIRHFEELGVLTINSSKAIGTVKDKLYTHQILARAGIPTPKTIFAKYPVDVDFVEKELGFPVVVKTITGSKGSGVFLCETRALFADLMEFLSGPRGYQNIIIQEFMKTSKGKDLRVFLIGGHPIAAMQRIAKEGSFKANFHQGGSVKPFDLNPTIEKLSVACAKLFELDIAGIDLLFDGDSYTIAEANSSPGFEGFESVNNISVPDLIFDYIESRLKK